MRSGPSATDRESGHGTAESFRELLDQIPAMHFATDPEGRILWVNRFGAEYLGYTPDELLGRSIMELVAPEDRDTLREGLGNCQRTPGRLCRWELRKVRKDGSILWVRETARPVLDPDGRRVNLVVCDDVTDERQVREELRESEELYRLLVDLVPQHVWITDPDGAHTYFSRRWYEFTGASHDSTLGEGWLHLLHPEDREQTVERWHHSLRTGEPYEVQYRFRDVRGGYRWFLGQALPQRDEEGRIVRWIGTLTDIDEQKRIVEERERLLAAEREAREQIATIFESISDAFIAVDAEWRLTYLNRRGEELIRAAIGRGAGEIVGKTLPDAMPEVWSSEFGEAHRRAMAQRTTVHYEGYLPAWNRWFAVHDYPSPGGLAIYFQDVTERKTVEQERERLLELEQGARAQAERAAREERALREAVAAVSASTTSEAMILQIAESAVAATGASGAVVTWIDSERNQVDSVAEAGRMPPHPESIAYQESYTRQVLEQNSPRIVQRLGELKGPLWGGAAASGFEDWTMLVLPLSREDAPFGALFLARAPEQAAFTDDEIARARTFGELATLAFRKLLLLEEAQRRREELERITESRARLMRGFSHDLKNPLGAADGHAQLLEDGIIGEVSPKQMDSVRRIRRSIKTALNLIQDLLELARTETGQIELQCENTDVSGVTGEAVEDFQAQAAAENLELRTTLCDGCMASTDPARVRQILSNLLSNALKYTAEGEVTVEVAAKGAGEGPLAGEWIAVTVADTGPGIPEDKQEQIFQEFTRLDASAPHGAGVGLAISRRIARALGGEITVQSEVGRGSRFTLWLPR